MWASLQSRANPSVNGIFKSEAVISTHQVGSGQRNNQHSLSKKNVSLDAVASQTALPSSLCAYITSCGLFLSRDREWMTLLKYHFWVIGILTNGIHRESAHTVRCDWFTSWKTIRERGGINMQIGFRPTPNIETDVKPCSKSICDDSTIKTPLTVSFKREHLCFSRLWFFHYTNYRL